MRKPLYKSGDKVKIVKYGHLIWQNKKLYSPEISYPIFKENDTIMWLDLSPELVGQEGVVDEVVMTQGIPNYSINGLNKHAWYQEPQMELV